MEILARIKDFVYGCMKCTSVGFRHYITQRDSNQKYTYCHGHHSAKGPEGHVNKISPNMLMDLSLL